MNFRCYLKLNQSNFYGNLVLRKCHHPRFEFICQRFLRAGDIFPVTNKPNMFKSPGVLLSQSTHKVLCNFKSIKLKHDWIAPEGYDTGIRVHCRINQEKVPFILLNKHFVKWYMCGPTVYDASHIGHASCYIRFDLINRILREFFDIRPVIALGITDLDDKIIKKALRKKVDFRVISKQYELEFFNHLRDLNILPPSFVLRVTEHIPEIIEFISRIIDKGKAYVTEDGSVYFDKVFSGEDEKEVCELSEFKAPLKVGQKTHAHFALWKGAKPSEPHWEAPWGRGRPGWHIECSAMASKLFGPRLDVHGGGVDLVFPHHANEEAQSRCYHDCPQWVNYWMHAGELKLMDVKMSKSLNNFITIADFLKKHTADHLRMFCFVSKYRKGLHYGADAMSLPMTFCGLIEKFLGDSASYVRGNWSRGNVSEAELLKELEETKEKVRRHLKDDFDTGQCHIVLMELIRKAVKMLNEETEKSVCRSPAVVAAIAQYIRDTYGAFGFQLGSSEAATAKDGHKMEFLLDQVVGFRDNVRSEALQLEEKSKRENLLKACDSLRSDLGTIGIVIKDQKNQKSSWSIVEVQQREEEKEESRTV